MPAKKCKLMQEADFR